MLQAFDVLVYNLKTNTDLFQIWKEIYADHVIETNNVLVYILHNYEGIQTSTVSKGMERGGEGQSEVR